MSTMQAKFAEFMCAPEDSAYVAEVARAMAEAGYELRKLPRPKSAKSPAEHDAFIAAKRTATERCGRWDLRSDCVWLDLPPRLRNFKFKRADGSLSVQIRNRRDHKAPAARYWPNGIIPSEVCC